VVSRVGVVISNDTDRTLGVTVTGVSIKTVGLLRRKLAERTELLKVIELTVVTVDAWRLAVSSWVSVDIVTFLTAVLVGVAMVKLTMAVLGVVETF
jgi:hypothetical protein